MQDHGWSAPCAELIGRLEVGRSISIDSTVWRVIGRVLATEDDETWAECKVTSASAVRWLSVETGTGVPEVSLWRRGEALQVGFDVELETLDGRAAARVGAGTGRFTAEGDCEVCGTEIPPSGEVLYREYVCGELSRRIALEWFEGGPLLVGRGRRIPPPAAMPTELGK